MFSRAGVQVDEPMALDNVELVKRAVEVENAVAIVPQRTVYAEVRGGRLIEARLDVPSGEILRPLGMVKRTGEALGPVAREFTELLRNERLFETQLLINPTLEERVLFDHVLRSIFPSS